MEVYVSMVWHRGSLLKLNFDIIVIANSPVMKDCVIVFNNYITAIIFNAFLRYLKRTLYVNVFLQVCWLLRLYRCVDCYACTGVLIVTLVQVCWLLRLYRCVDCYACTGVLIVTSVQVCWLLHLYRCVNCYTCTGVLIITPVQVCWLLHQYRCVDFYICTGVLIVTPVQV